MGELLSDVKNATLKITVAVIEEFEGDEFRWDFPVKVWMWVFVTVCFMLLDFRFLFKPTIALLTHHVFSLFPVLYVVYMCLSFGAVVNS